MSREISELKSSAALWDKPEDGARLYLEIENLIANLKGAKAILQERFIYLKQEGKAERITISDSEYLYVANEKKEQFKTEAIYDLFNVPQELRDILEKNPGFRKTALAAYLGSKDAVKEYVEVTYTDKVKVEKMDTKFLK